MRKHLPILVLAIAMAVFAAPHASSAEGEPIIDDALTPLFKVTGLEGVDHVVADPDGAYVYTQALNDDTSTIVKFELAPLTPTMGITPTLTEISQTTINLDSVVEDRHTNHFHISPDGDHLYMTEDDTIHAIDSSTLTDLETYTVDGTVTGIDLSPGGEHLYVTVRNPDGDVISVWARDASTGLLTAASTTTGEGLGTLSWADSILISPDGEQAYTQSDDALYTELFSRDTTTGALTHVEEHFIEGPLPPIKNFWFASPSGEHLFRSLLLPSDNEAMGTWERDFDTGLLTQLPRTLQFADIRWEDGILSQDGLRGFMVGNQNGNRGTIHLTQYDDVTGIVTPRVWYFNEELEGWTDLVGLRDLALSPDGTLLYVVAEESGALHIIGQGQPFPSLLKDASYEFEKTVSPWEYVTEDDFINFRFANAYHGAKILLLRANNATEGTIQRVPFSGSSGDEVVATFRAGGRNVAKGGLIGAQVFLYDAEGTPLEATFCLLRERGTFGATEFQCNITASQDYDAIEVRVGWRRITKGLMGYDGISLEVR